MDARNYEQSYRTTWQRYLCPGEHGSWWVQRDGLTGEWLLAKIPGRRDFIVAASRPICGLCGRDLVEVATIDALLTGPSETRP